MQADEEYKELHNEYTKILVDADEKIQLANQMYDLVERYMRRLDSELFKFKCELEADHNGITEILEKRSLELEGGSVSAGLNNTLGNNLPSSQKENRFFGMLSNNNGNSSAIQNRERYRSRPEKRRNSSSSNAPPEKRLAINAPSSSTATTVINVNSSTPAVVPSPSIQTSLPFSIQHPSISNANSPIGAGTSSMTPGRRASNVKAASFDSLSSSPSVSELTNNRDLSLASVGVVSSSELDSNGIFNSQRRHKKYVHLTAMFAPCLSQLNLLSFAEKRALICRRGVSSLRWA